MPKVRLISLDETGAWYDALARCGRYDCYHLPAYHRLAREQGEGQPYLLAFDAGGRSAALPFVLRPVADVDGLSDCTYSDAASVYGYPGLIASIGRSEPGAGAFRSRFMAELRHTLDRLGVVTFFGRQNPLFDSAWLFPSQAQTAAPGPTVVVDLRQPEEEQVRSMRKGHRYDLRCARKAGITVNEDREFERVDTFRRLYIETMRRAGAAGYYFFSEQYFAALKPCLREHVKLFFAEHQGNPLSGAVFLLCGDIIQYHLSGTATRFLKHRGAVKLILDEVRRWGSRNGFRWLHLGGGRGAREDSLFDFKAGFGNVRRAFHTVRLVVNPHRYRQLIQRRVDWARSHGFATPGNDFFPQYRQPCQRRAA